MIKCKCGTYHPYRREVEGRNIAHAMHMDACINCGYVPTKAMLEAEQTQPPGLGDKVETVMRAIGVKQLTEFVHEKTGFDCGCDKRKKQLNEWSRKWSKK